MPKPLVVIWDIDKTLADCSHREHLLRPNCVVCLTVKTSGLDYMCKTCGVPTDSQMPQSSWDLFSDPELVIKDKAYPEAVAAFTRFAELGVIQHAITGRDDLHRGVTLSWLRQVLPWDDKDNQLYTRKQAVRDLPSSVYKERALRELIRTNKYDDHTFLFFEDDSHVFGVYAKFGIVIKCPDAWEKGIVLPAPANGHEKSWKL